MKKLFPVSQAVTNDKTRRADLCDDAHACSDIVLISLYSMFIAVRKFKLMPKCLSSYKNHFHT